MSFHSNKRLVLILPLILASALFAISPSIPPAHAATGLVCITGSATATSCPASPPSLGPFAVGQSFSVGVFISGSDAMGGFDVYVAVNTAILNPTGAALGPLIVSPSLTSICINGLATAGSCTANTANGPGVVEVTTIESSGGNECGGISPCSGMAFTITYSVVGSTPSTPLSYPTSLGCSASSVSSPANVCVEVADNTGTILSENIQSATVTQAAVIHPTSTSINCSPSSVVINQATSCTATVTDTSGGPTTPTGSVSFTTNSTGTFSPTLASCTLAAGTTAGTGTCSLSYSPTVTGHHLITSSYGGDSTHATSQSAFSIPVAPTPPHTTTTSISCLPGSLTVNTASSCTATVTDQSTTPTTPSGSVILATNSTGTFTPFSASCTLAAGTSAGTASCSVSYQPSVTGHHLLTGSYGGDSTHSSGQGTFLLASTPTPPHTTATSVTCTPGSVTSGASTSCAATVTDTSSSPTTPSGSVSFTTNSTGTFSPTSASCTLSAAGTAGTASCSVSYTPSSTAVGHHLITGTYGGDSGHSTSNGSFNLAATAPPPHPTTTSIQCVPATAQVNTPSTCTATVTDTSTSGATTPTGSVSFTTNSTGTFSPVSASCALAAGTVAGTATCQVTYTPGATAIGHHLITGNYLSDSTHLASSGSFKLAVTAVPLHTTTTSVKCTPSQVQAGVSTSCTATVTDGAVTGSTTPSGSVSFTTNSTGTFSPIAASCTLAAGATAGTAGCSVTYTATVAGHHLITGNYQGDSTHAISQGTFLLAATPAPHLTSTSVQCSPGSLQVSTSSTCRVTVTDTSGTLTTPTGTADFTTNSTGTFNPTSASCTLAAGTTAGTATCQVSYTPGATAVGHHLITGNYGGDSIHLTSSGSFNLAATAAPPPPPHATSTTVQCSPAPVQVSTPTSCTATVTDTSAAGVTTPSGSVSFTSNSTGTFNPTSVSCTLAAGTTAGTATCSVSYLPGASAVGHHLITGTYGSDASHQGSTGSFNLAVTAAPALSTTTTVQCTPQSVQVGDATSCTATVVDGSSSPTTPSGSVSFTTNSTGTFSPTSASCTLSAAGTAGTASCSVSYTPSSTAVGHHLITGTYGGDSGHSTSNGSFNLPVTAVPFDYSLSNSGPVSVTQGSSGTVTVTARLTTGSVQPVTLSCVSSSLPAGITCGSFTVNPVTPTTAGATSVLTISVTSSVTPGPYSFMVTGSPLSATTAPTTVSITITSPVIPPLTVDFSFSPSSPSTGQSVSFTSVVSGGIGPYTYAWDFGDGGTSTAANPSRTYSTAGSFTVKLTITDSSSPTLSQTASHDVSVGPVTGQKDFTISASPTSITVVGESPLCEGASTLCDDEGSTTITLTSINGFDGTVRLARSVSPRNGLLTVYCRQGATQLMPGATVKIRCFVEPEINSDSQTTFTVTITGRFGAFGSTGFLSHSVTITVTVTHAPTVSDDNGGDPPSSPLAASTGTSSTGATTAVGGLVVASGTHVDPRGDAHGRGHAHGHSGHHHSHSA